MPPLLLYSSQFSSSFPTFCDSEWSHLTDDGVTIRSCFGDRLAAKVQCPGGLTEKSKSTDDEYSFQIEVGDY